MFAEGVLISQYWISERNFVREVILEVQKEKDERSTYILYQEKSGESAHTVPAKVYHNRIFCSKLCSIECISMVELAETRLASESLPTVTNIDCTVQVRT